MYDKAIYIQVHTVWEYIVLIGWSSCFKCIRTFHTIQLIEEMMESQTNFKDCQDGITKTNNIPDQPNDPH